MIASAEWATRRATPWSTFSFARTAMLSERRCGWATSESRRSATHVAPVAFFTAAPTKWIEFGGEVVRTTSIPSFLRDPDRRRDRGQVPAHVLVRDEQPARGEPRLDERALEPLLAVQLLGGLAALRPEVARAVHPGLRRHAQVGVLVDPLRVVGREHVGLDPERRQVLRELERPLDAAAARRRPVERDEQQLHARRWYCPRYRLDP